MDRCSSNRPRVLVLLAGLWPGHEANGPSQSLTALASALSSEFEFSIVARDRPFGSRGRGLAPANVWVRREEARFLYLEGRPRRVRGLRRAILRTPHDVLMLNSLLDPEFTIPVLLMRKLGLIPSRPIILAPRGELSPGAIAIKSHRKQVYLRLARALRLFEGVIFQATGPREADEIAQLLPETDRILVAPNVRPPAAPPPASSAVEGAPLRLIYLSRIDRKKNLGFALDVLARTRAQVRYDIYGPVSDPGYWAECQARMATLPANVEVRYWGAVPNGEVHGLFGRYDALFLPTRGENFGHAIVDALAAGCPVLISDQTPWIDLETQRAGWSLALDEPGFVGAVESLAAMSGAQRRQLRDGARRLAETALQEADAVAASRLLLLTALKSSDNRSRAATPQPAHEQK